MYNLLEQYDERIVGNFTDSTYPVVPMRIITPVGPAEDQLDGNLELRAVNEPENLFYQYTP